MPEQVFGYRSTSNFEVVSQHLRKHCRINRELASKRLHAIKAFHGFGGADNVVFDFSGTSITPHQEV